MLSKSPGERTNRSAEGRGLRSSAFIASLIEVGSDFAAGKREPLCPRYPSSEVRRAAWSLRLPLRKGCMMDQIAAGFSCSLGGACIQALELDEELRRLLGPRGGIIGRSPLDLHRRDPTSCARPHGSVSLRRPPRPSRTCAVTRWSAGVSANNGSEGRAWRRLHGPRDGEAVRRHRFAHRQVPATRSTAPASL